MKYHASTSMLLALVSVCFYNTEAAAVEPMTCMAHYQSKASNTGPAPGTLATRKDTPCRLSRHISGKGRGTHEAGGMDIIKQPKNGKVEIENLSSLIFTPRTGFTGEDIIVIRMKYGNGKGGVVRFVVSVD